MKRVIFVLSLFLCFTLTAFAQTSNMVVIPSSPETGQIVRVIATDGEYPYWRKSGGVWCADADCEWYSDMEETRSFNEVFWKTSQAGTFTITAVDNDSGSLTPISITVVDP